MTFEIGGICPHCRSTFRCDCFAAEAAPTGEFYQNELSRPTSMHNLHAIKPGMATPATLELVVRKKSRGYDL